MPVIVIGGDTPAGRAIVHRLTERAGEVRAFVSSADEAATQRSRGVKVAVGDLSDDSHVRAAAAGAFCAVLITEATTDGRELAFAAPGEVVAGWLRAAEEARVTRVIVVGGLPGTAPAGISEIRVLPAVDMSAPDLAEAVAALDEVERL
ncbi:MAG TPA: NAD(P)H-binding protein [Acidimicrobiia bacterium]|nr:NAD(P)H-binding protein [Acidimicrobiia bacterium]